MEEFESTGVAAAIRRAAAHQDPLRPLPESPVVMVLRDALAQALAGRVTSVAILAIGPRGEMTTPAEGLQLAQLNTAADMFKTQLMTHLLASASRITRPA